MAALRRSKALLDPPGSRGELKLRMRLVVKKSTVAGKGRWCWWRTTTCLASDAKRRSSALGSQVRLSLTSRPQVPLQ